MKYHVVKVRTAAEVRKSTVNARSSLALSYSGDEYSENRLICIQPYMIDPDNHTHKIKEPDDNDRK